jgi:hypothetical protein
MLLTCDVITFTDTAFLLLLYYFSLLVLKLRIGASLMCPCKLVTFNWCNSRLCCCKKDMGPSVHDPNSFPTVDPCGIAQVSITNQIANALGGSVQRLEPNNTRGKFTSHMWVQFRNWHTFRLIRKMGRFAIVLLLLLLALVLVVLLLHSGDIITTIYVCISDDLF